MTIFFKSRAAFRFVLVVATAIWLSASMPATGQVADPLDDEISRAATFDRGENIHFLKPLPPESLRANEAFRESLGRNVHVSEVLHRLSSRIRLFEDAAPRIFVTKCIDGRVHSSDDLGYPATTVTIVRTEGTRVDLSPNNSVFWNRLHGVMLDANRHTPGCPALFLAMAHRGDQGTGCAAHEEHDDQALAEVRVQAETLRKNHDYRQVYVIYGMNNTDDRSNRLFFPDGHEIDTAQIIQHLDTPQAPLRWPTDVFQARFLDQLLDDREANLFVGSQAPRMLMDGKNSAMFHDLQVMITMQAYLITEVSHIVHNHDRNNIMFEPRLWDMVLSQVDAVKDLPEELKAPLVYQTIWNVMYTLHERARLAAMTDEQERAWELSHAEKMVAYGEGFEIEPRNTLVLVRPGRGNDLDALSVARTVILKHRHRRKPQDHPPLVHINVEISGEIDTWQAYNDGVLCKLLTMMSNVHTVFDRDCRVLTTFSYRGRERFYPVRVEADPTVSGGDIRECFPADVAVGFTNDNYSRNELILREDAYTRSLLSARPR